VLSADFVLPSAAVFPDGSACLSAQVVSSPPTRPKLQLIRLSPSGQVTKQIAIEAAQGVVADGPEGTCALLYSSSFDYANSLRLASFDSSLRRQWDSVLPFDGLGGRKYRLHAVSDGFLAVALTGGDKRSANVAKFSRAGKLVWTEPLTDEFEDLVFGAGWAYFLTQSHDVHNEAFRVSRVQFD
jgi:hypothetical protein